MELITRIENLLTEAKENAKAFYEKGNKAAGTRLRKNAMDIRHAANGIRQEVSEKKKGE